MKTNVRGWPWAAALALLLPGLAPAAAAGQDASQQELLLKEKAKVVADLNLIANQVGQNAGQQNCQACHNVTAAHSQNLAPVQSVLNLTNNLTTDRSFFAVFHDPADAALGATLEPASDALRAQLGIPSGQGLVVASLAGDGPAAEAGLKEKDVLLEVADRPLASADDLPRQLKAAGEAPVRLRLVRAGKPLSLQVRPIYQVTLGPVAERKSDYYLGIAVTRPDETLRTHVELPAGVGLVATETVANSPADKAGVKVHDILLELDGKPLEGPETLVAQVQAVGNKPATLKLLRGGKPMTLSITPELRKVETAPYHGAVRYWSVTPGYQPHGDFRMPGHGYLQPQPGELHRWTTQDDPVDQRLDRLDRELKALREAIDDVRTALKDGKAKGGN
jgi:C-terminal processing protease CtpA/Prc